MKTTRRLMIMVVALALPLAMMTTATAVPTGDICVKLPNHPSCTDPDPRWR